MTTVSRNSIVQLKRASASYWNTSNPVLRRGEPGYETDTGRLKIGDGTKTWSLLPYVDTTNLTAGLATKSDIGHTHAANQITSGTISIDRLPTGTTGTTVSFGNHTHDASAIVSGTIPTSRLPASLTLMGTTAERDIAFPTPTTNAQRVALANQNIVWYNKTSGWWESYYATTGLSGLTARGLQSGISSGWYPVSEGPYIRLQPTSSFSAVANNPVRSWGTMTRSGGSSWFSYNDTNGRISIPVAGRYQVRAQTTQQTGTGTANYHLRVLNAGSYEQHVDGVAVTLVSNLFTLAHAEMEIPILASREVDFFVQSGTLNVHQAGTTGIRGEFLVRYKGPLLVTD